MNADRNIGVAGRLAWWHRRARLHRRSSAANISCLLMRPGVAHAARGGMARRMRRTVGGMRCAVPPYAMKAEPVLGRWRVDRQGETLPRARLPILVRFVAQALSGRVLGRIRRPIASRTEE